MPSGHAISLFTNKKHTTKQNYLNFDFNIKLNKSTASYATGR